MAKKSESQLDFEAKLTKLQKENSDRWNSFANKKVNQKTNFDERKIMESYLSSLLDTSVDHQEVLDTLVSPSEAIQIQEEKKIEPFLVMLFKLYNVTLGVPLHTLSYVSSKRDKIIKLPGRPSWYLGLLNKNNTKMHIADPAKWLLGSKRGTLEPREYNFFIGINGSPWALACHEILETSLLFPEDVNWRSNTKSIPWVSGVVRDKLCTLLDLNSLIKEITLGFDVKKLEDQ